MKIAIIAYGRTGCRIAENFARFESLSRNHPTELTVGIDTGQRQLNNLKCIDDDHTILIGYNKHEGRGTGRDLADGVSAAKRSAASVLNATNGVSKFNMDAFVVIGSLAGGTGGGGAPLVARDLGNRFDLPVYGVGVLPSNHEPDVYKLNAARSMQSFARETDNLILFDNDHLGIAEPKYMPGVSPDVDLERHWRDANQDIARCLHMLFTADEINVPSRLEGSQATTQDLNEILNTGGISTMCYAAEELPRAAQPGIYGRFWELVDFYRTLIKVKLHERQQDRVNNSIADETGVTDSADEGPVSEPRNAPDMGKKPSFERDWPRPAKLAPLLLDPGNAMINCNPGHTTRSLFILGGPKRLLTSQNPIEIRDWASKETSTQRVIAGNYPMKSKKVCTLAVCSHIPLPNRVLELQNEASTIAEQINKHRAQRGDPKDLNVFDNVRTEVPPSF
jgi:hypothetical protein